MKTLEKANKTRKQKALDKLYRFSDYGIASFKQLIDQGVFDRAICSYEPTKEFNRRKYNQCVSYKEQERYEQSIEDSKRNVYYLQYKHDNTVKTRVSRFVYEYCVEWLDNKHYQENKEQYASDSELDHLFNVK